jgi:hypothetical protein
MTSGLAKNLWKWCRSSRAVPLRSAGQGAQGGQGVARPGVAAERAGAGRQAQAIGHVPDRDLPLLRAGVLDDLPLGLVGLVCLDPHAAERGVNVVGEPVGQRHEVGSFR